MDRQRIERNPAPLAHQGINGIRGGLPVGCARTDEDFGGTAVSFDAVWFLRTGMNLGHQEGLAFGGLDVDLRHDIRRAPIEDAVDDLFFQGKKLIVGDADNFAWRILHTENNLAAGAVGKGNGGAGHLLAFGKILLEFQPPRFRLIKKGRPDLLRRCHGRDPLPSGVLLETNRERPARPPPFSRLQRPRPTRRCARW